MSIEAWPFLVSRNRDIDYRTVVAPDFIFQAGISNLLARVADGDLTKPGHAFIRRVQGSKAGDFTIIFRVVEATEKDINPEGGNQVLKDSFGREIYLLEGLVVQGTGKVTVVQKDIEKAHALLIKNYSQFWGWTAPSAAISSEAFSLAINKASIPLNLEELELFQVRSKAPEPQPQPKPISIGFLVAVIAFLLLAIGIIFNSFGFLVNQLPESKDDKCNQQAQTKYTSAAITGKLASDLSVPSGRYWIIGTEGCDFIVTKNGKSFYKTGQQITTSNLGQKMNYKIRNEEQSITFNQKASEILKKLQKDNGNAAIFISGSLKVASPENQSNPNRYQTISFQMNYHPIEQAINQLGNQVVTGTIKAKIIDPKPKFK